MAEKNEGKPKRKGGDSRRGFEPVGSHAAFCWQDGYFRVRDLNTRRPIPMKGKRG